MTMNTEEVPLDFHYTDSEFCAKEMSFGFLKYSETKNDIIF